MSLVQRAASVAALSFALVGLIAHSSASFAAESATVPVPKPAIIMFQNGQTPMAVPAPDAQQTPMSAPTTPSDSEDLQDGDIVAYPTLAAAVAAKQLDSDTDENLRCLAGAIYYEAKGEPLAGQLAVADVILNRVAAGRFGDSVCEVVKQPGQFSFVRNGRIPAVPESRASYRTAMAVAKVAMDDVWDSEASKALYFHARRVSPGWNKVRIAAIGNHVFYR